MYFDHRWWWLIFVFGSNCEQNMKKILALSGPSRILLPGGLPVDYVVYGVDD
jgi:hypothetical protein